MAQLPYTDGANGCGYTDADELLRYFRRRPLALYDHAVTDSYAALLAAPEREAQLLAVFDAEGSSAAVLREVDLRMPHDPSRRMAVHNAYTRLRLRWKLELQREGLPLDPPDDAQHCCSELMFMINNAAAVGRTYTLCIECTAAENAGHATDQLCARPAATQREHDGGWTTDNLMLVCCAAAQCLRDRKPDASERMVRKLEVGKAAIHADAAQRALLQSNGRLCDSPACGRREPFAAAFKACSRCRAAHYCCPACQVRRVPTLCASQRAAEADSPGLACSPSAQKSDWRRHKRSCGC